jgi:hypothetical protein
LEGLFGDELIQAEVLVGVREGEGVLVVGKGLVGMQGLGFEGRVEVEVGGLATVGVGRVREGDVVADHAAGEIIDVVDGKEGLLLLSAKDVGLAP